MSRPLSLLSEFLSIPSVSTQPEHAPDMAAARDFLVKYLTSLGFSTQILPSSVHPAVFAQYLTDPSLPTVIVYGHYDVQPAGAPSQWTTPPFSPNIRKGKIYARGATDNKGQLLIHLLAAENLIRTQGPKLPLNLKFIIEGEEEIGSPSVAELAKTNSDLFSADYILVSDTEMLGEGQPAIDISLRGVWDVEIQIQTSSHDLHSGQFGGVAPNPAFILSHMLTRLKNGAGRVTIPHFYDDIVPPTDEELRDFRKTEPSPDQLLKEGHYYYLGGGENRFSLNRRRWAEPTLDITGLDSGYTGHGSKSIIPDMASAKLSFRIVPNQSPVRLYRHLVDYLQQLAPRHAVLRIISYPDAMYYKAPTDLPIFDLAKDVLKKTFGRPAVFQGQGGSIGFIPSLSQAISAPAILIGFGLADENLHAPNEHLSLDNFFKGISAMTSLYTRLSELV